MGGNSEKLGADSSKGIFVLSAVTAALLASFAGSATAATTEELDQRIKVLERQIEIQQEDAATKAKDTPVVTANDKGFSFKSPKGDYEFKFRGLVQADTRFFLDDKSPRFNDTNTLRRIEPTFELTLGKIAFARIQPQFNGDTASTSDVYGELRLAPEFYLRAGKFKEPVVLENLQATGNIEFIERGLPNELGPNRDQGIQIGGEVFNTTVSYALGYFNGSPDGRDSVASDVDNRKEVAGRLFLEPFKNDPGFLQGLGVGVGGSYGVKDQGSANSANSTSFLPRYRTPGQNQIFSYRGSAAASGSTPASTGVYADGAQTRISPQAYFYRNSFGLLAEYITSEQELAINADSDKLKNEAWQVYASYLLTGEDAGYRGIKVRQPFKLDGPGWGAFELALRYGELKIDSDAFPIYANPTSAISKESSYAVGINWYLNNNLKVVLNYTNTKFDGGGGGTSAAPLDREDEKAIFGRFQVFF